MEGSIRKREKTAGWRIRATTGGRMGFNGERGDAERCENGEMRMRMRGTGEVLDGGGGRA